MDELFVRIGAFLADHALSPDPEHYAFAHAVLSDPDGALAAAVVRLTDGGIRLTRRDVESLGHSIVAGAPANDFDDEPEPENPADDAGAQADELVEQTREQVASFAGMMRAMQDETRDFGRDLAERAAEMARAGPAPSMGEVARITAGMVARIRAAERRLDQATREADDLRDKLEEARLAARRDPLTGLPNRRALEEAYSGRDRGVSACVALFDIDRFKRINDGYGHAVGDRVLRAVGQVLAETCEEHLVARYGGEEFAVMLSGVRLETAADLLEEARYRVGAKRFRTRDTDAPIGQVTISAGLTAIRDDEVMGTALARADRLLYAAKSTGRDKLCIE